MPLKETKTFAKKAIGDLIEKHGKNTLESIEKDIKEIESPYYIRVRWQLSKKLENIRIIMSEK